MPKNIYKLGKGIRIFLAISSIVLIAACSKVNQSNYNQVKKGMSKEQVYSILGNPTQQNNVNVAGMQGTSSVWKSGDTTITIQFMNDKVVISSLVSGEKDN